MYILTCNKYPIVASEDYKKLEEVMQKEIDAVLNNPKYDEQRHTVDEVWYYNGVSHFYKKYRIEQITTI
jgi:hypothetical protein